MSKAPTPWYLPTPELIAANCRFTRWLHRVVAVAGLLLGIGEHVAQMVGADQDLLDGLGTIVGFVLGFALLALAPSSLLSLMVCAVTAYATAQTILLWLFIAALWFGAGGDRLVTGLFLVYALAVLAPWLKAVFDRRARHGRPRR